MTGKSWRNEEREEQVQNANHNHDCQPKFVPTRRQRESGPVSAKSKYTEVLFTVSADLSSYSREWEAGNPRMKIAMAEIVWREGLPLLI